MLFVLDMISISTVNGRTSTIIGILIDVILLFVPPLASSTPSVKANFENYRLAFWIPLIYGVVVWRRSKITNGAYAPVATPLPSETLYPSQYKHFVAEEAIAVEPTRPSAVGGRRLSYNHTRDTRFESFRHERRSLSNPDMGLGNEVIISGNGSVPSVRVGDHDLEAFEMDSARRSMR